ncbi:hypothetical protein ACJ6YJ_27745 [Pseudomonas marginalis]|uniref:hypothetical protein n=1 Tax=Pseudomonas TaxID=286 RepID=UPI00081BD115|nr:MULTISPECIES: hypothetical protein [unclassified Pseudomonas]MDT9632571.1 hypothetical protein [Pseudomonas sp. JV449]TKJ76460.1 hypothetical protein PspCFBP13509_23955 [Pseudomonas sp. CFBP13509]
MVIRNASNHAIIAADIGWTAEDVGRYIVHIEPMADGSGYFLLPHQDMPGVPRFKPVKLGNDWVIKTGAIQLECL